LSATYNYICQLYQSRGYLTVAESNYANQIYQMLVGLNTQKMIVDKERTDEMIKHLIKMKANVINCKGQNLPVGFAPSYNKQFN